MRASCITSCPVEMNETFTIMANVCVDTTGCSKGNEYSVKAYPVPENPSREGLHMFFN
jgi:hypothetical protein